MQNILYIFYFLFLGEIRWTFHMVINHFITFCYFQYRIILPLLNTISQHLHSGVFTSFFYVFKKQTNKHILTAHWWGPSLPCSQKHLWEPWCFDAEGSVGSPPPSPHSSSPGPACFLHLSSASGTSPPTEHQWPVPAPHAPARSDH